MREARTPFARATNGFTLLELLVAMAIFAVLATLVLMGVSTYRKIAQRAVCSSNLRQISTAVNLYMGDNNGYFPPYMQQKKDGTRMWFFGKETSPVGMPEGKRTLDQESGPLYPYIQDVGGIEICPSFNYENALFKPKFKGASYGYGYNWTLGGRSGGAPKHASQLASAARVVLFGDCGQVNTFQSPASPSKPMIEEFYILSESERTAHFRHGGSANMLFVDGHVETFKPYPGTEDKRIPNETVGMIAKKGDFSYFR